MIFTVLGLIWQRIAPAIILSWHLYLQGIARKNARPYQKYKIGTLDDQNQLSHLPTSVITTASNMKNPRTEKNRRNTGHSAPNCLLIYLVSSPYIDRWLGYQAYILFYTYNKPIYSYINNRCDYIGNIKISVLQKEDKRIKQNGQR